MQGKCAMTNAVKCLTSMRRWCVTGTPFNNAFHDLNGQFSFFGIDHFDKNFWLNSAEFAGSGRNSVRYAIYNLHKF